MENASQPTPADPSGVDSTKETTSHLPSPDSIDAAEVLNQAAGLAQHLQRMGVQWIPQSNPDSVEAITNQFASKIVDDPTSKAPPTSAEKTSSSPTVKPPTVDSPNPMSSEASSRPPRDTPTESSAVVNGGLGQPYPGNALAPDQRAEQLAALGDRVASCTRCEMLAKCRTKTVFGEGNASPRVVFFGEGPGRDEDLSGRPFVGKAGQLLTKMIEACKFRREDVYIMNTVKCRPPNNRNPEPTEIHNCREYFEAQLNLLQPEYIVCLGLVSAQALLDTKLSVGRMRGKFHSYFASKVVVTYHPAYLLRTPAAKKAAWDDLQMMLRDAGIL